MTTKDIIFDTFGPDKTIEMDRPCPSTGTGKLAYTPFQRAQIAMNLKARKRQLEKVLKTTKKGFDNVKKKSRSCSKSVEPPVRRGRETRKNRMMRLHIVLQGKKYLGKSMFLYHWIMIRSAMIINQLDLIKIN